MNEREKMLKKVMEYEFSVIDAGLYLDSYPDNECAVDYFLKTRAMRNNTVSDYERKFGALTIYGDNITDSDGWTWTDTPWPWEMGDC